jgi:hypothetical protein
MSLGPQKTDSNYKTDFDRNQFRNFHYILYSHFILVYFGISNAFFLKDPKLLLRIQPMHLLYKHHMCKINSLWCRPTSGAKELRLAQTLSLHFEYRNLRDFDKTRYLKCMSFPTCLIYFLFILQAILFKKYRIFKLFMDAVSTTHVSAKWCRMFSKLTMTGDLIRNWKKEVVAYFEVSTPNIIANVRHAWLYECAFRSMRKKL